MGPAPVVFAIVLACLVIPGAAPAVDRPVDGVKLSLIRTSTRQKLVFVSRDPAALFPAIGGADDPGTGSPGGALIDLISPVESATLAVPRVAGMPGWTARAGTTDLHRFTNGSAPAGISAVRLVVVREGRVLKLVARATGLALAGAQGSVGIRVTTGALRNCALFDAPTVDEAGRFVARGALASALADCSDTSLGALPTTTTTTATTTTTVTPCSGFNGPCVNGFGCCPGLTCLATGGPGGLGFCTNQTCSGPTQVCDFGGLPCCPGLLCADPPGFPGHPYDFCLEPSGVTRCCDQFPGVCADLPEEISPAACPTADAGLVCDGLTGGCLSERQGVSFCCQLSGACFEGPAPETLCGYFSGTLLPGLACLPTGVCGSP